MRGFDAAGVRRDFPVLQRRIRSPDGRDRDLVYLDHGASTHAPQPVLDAVMRLMTQHYANVHRGNHTLSQESSDLWDDAVDTIGAFVGAHPERQVAIAVGNTTQAIDLASHLVGHLPGKILTTLTEHHSNDLPHRARSTVLHAQVDSAGRLDVADVEEKLRDNEVKLLAVTGASNVTGIMPPIHKLARLAHAHGARILVDAAQLYAHAPIDVKRPDSKDHIDFLAAAGHKAYAPFGSAVLVAPRDVADEAPPYLPGGGTVQWVTDGSALYSKSPDRHQGGTPNVAGMVAFAESTRYLQRIGMDKVRRHELALVKHGLRRFEELADSGVALLGPHRVRDAKDKLGVFAFLVDGHTHAGVSTLLDRHYGIATRNGCFCAHPLLHRLLKLGDTSKWIEALTRGQDIELPGATRATLGIYNTEAEVDLLCDAVAAIARGEHNRIPVSPQMAAESS